MAYFNHAFNKTFVVSSVEQAAGTATSALAAGELALVGGSDWKSVAIPGGAAVPAALSAGELAYIVQGSFYTKDTIGNNPGHGGYKESVKSKGINPRYLTRMWAANCLTASQATAKLCLASDCAPCGKTQFMRIDVKGSPALRFLNHNAYAIADSANVCCVEGQEYIDPALIIANMAQMALGDPLIKPFVAEADVKGVAGSTLSAGGSGYTVSTQATSGSSTGSGATINIVSLGVSDAIATYSVANAGAGYVVGDVLAVAGGTDGAVLVDSVGDGGVIVTTTTAGVSTSAVYSIAEIIDGTYVASTDPHGATKVSACVEFVGAYVDTVFGNCSFDTRDHFNAEPVEIIVSLLDETGNPCNDCGVASATPGSMQQTKGEEVIRELIMSERYRQSPYNQGNADSARIREIELSDELLAAVDRTSTYRAYYVQHSVPRFNNPSGVFDNDQYQYKIYVKCDDTAAQVAMEDFLQGLQAWAKDNGNNLPIEENAVW
tara:strand:+ start:2231 stop:3703 length:1473 start_codon:yes stop_codon:yes gene_type:complete